MVGIWSRMGFGPRATRAAAAVACVVLLSGSSAAQQASTAGGEAIIPPNATALEGVPAVELDATREAANRRVLGRAEAAGHGLKVVVKDGRYYWASRQNVPLTLSASGEFTYLASTEPGHYIRLRKLNDRISYVEHVDTDSRSVTYWGEVRIVVGK